MHKEIFPTITNPEIKVTSVDGDLQVAGWERLEFSLKANGDEFSVKQEGDSFVVSSDSESDLILYVPQASTVKVNSVSGDMDLRAMTGAVSVVSVGGDLQVRSVGPLKIGQVSGDIDLRSAEGECSIESVGGEASIKDLQGSLNLSSVGDDLQVRNIGPLKVGQVGGDFILRSAEGDCSIEGVGGDTSIEELKGSLSISGTGADLYIREVLGGIQASAGADVVVFFIPDNKFEYDISAGNSVLMRLPQDVNATLSLASGSSIRVDMPGADATELMSANAGDLVLGDGAASISISAGNEIVITHRAEEWDSMAEFGPSAGEGHRFHGVPPIPPIPPIPHLSGLSDKINQKIAKKIEQANERISEHTSRVTESAMRRAGAAVRRAEQKMEAAEQRSRFSGFSGRSRAVVIEHNLKFRPVQPLSEPISGEERLTILKMLEEKKISLQDAESLLAALDGK